MRAPEVEATAARLAKARTPREAALALARFEDLATPEEFLTLAARVGGSDTQGAALVRDGALLADLAAQPRPRAWERREVTPEAWHFTAPGAAAGRTLLVCFAGRKNRMMVPLAAFLQRIPSEHYDVLLLNDPAMNHFRGGCPGLATDFPGLAAEVGRRFGHYPAIAAMGASMGALPAIRFALAVPCRWAVSLSCRPFDDIARIFAPEGPPPAFDPVCACTPGQLPQGLFVHSEANWSDKRWSRHYAGLIGASTLAVRGASIHTMIAELWQAGRLDGFMRHLFGALPPRRPDAVYDSTRTGRQPSQSRQPWWRRLLPGRG